MSGRTTQYSREEQKRREAMIAEFQRLSQVSSLETAQFHQTAAAHYGLAISDMKALQFLLVDGPMTAGQIASRLGLTTGAVTSLVDRLERRGFARRVDDSSDRRKVVVQVNKEKLRPADSVYYSIGERFAGLLRTYPTDDIELILNYTRRSIELTRDEARKLAAGSDDAH